jgi:hypothetical protein
MGVAVVIVMFGEVTPEETWASTMPGNDSVGAGTVAVMPIGAGSVGPGAVESSSVDGGPVDGGPVDADEPFVTLTDGVGIAADGNGTES